MQDDGGEDGQQVGESGRDIYSTPSDDVEILEGQDQELVPGTGTHLGFWVGTWGRVFCYGASVFCFSFENAVRVA